MLDWVLTILLMLTRGKADDDARCEELSITMCKEFGYSSVRFPNEMGQSNQEDAGSDLQHLQSFIETGCSADLKLFLCSLYAPYCNKDSSSTQILPCRDLCINVRDRCLPVMVEQFSYDHWPNSWKCGRFPYVKGMCVEGIEKPKTVPPENFSPVIEEPTSVPTTKPVEPHSDDTYVVENNNCRDDQMPCDGGKCIPITFRCDKFSDCNDGADEMHCDKCLTNQFMCGDKSQCISKSSRCDGVDDCSGGSDEIGCTSCPGTEFQCDVTRCISNIMKCDTRFDCKDHSDELNCGTCDVGTWQCTNGKCIDENLKCDGENDCGDNSDESSEDASCVNDPDSEDPQENADETEGAEDKDNNSEYTLPTCTKSTRDCNLDTDCKKEMDNYRRECQQQMESSTMIKCPVSCTNAYHQLYSRNPHGESIISEQCDQMGVKNVKFSCIRSTPSLQCLEALSECRESSACMELQAAYNRQCGATLNYNEKCTKSCADAYTNFIKSPTSEKMKAACIELNTSIPVRCGPMSKALDSSAQSNNKKNGAHRLYAILLTVSLLYHALLSS